MTNAFAYDVFLSYSSLDKPRVRRLARQLRDAGLRIWFDEWVIRPGDDIFLEIEHGLEGSRVLVLCMSPWAFRADWVRLERSTTVFRDPASSSRRLVPLLLADCEIPDTIRRLRYIDYREESDLSFGELVSACSPGTETNPRVVAMPSDNSVLPLQIAEDRYLQVLVSQFSLSKCRGAAGNGFELSVVIDNNTPTIWSKEGKRYLRGILSEDMRKQYQQRLDDFLLYGRGSDNYHFNDPTFFFRYASGGTLPIITFTGGAPPGDYYCLFYRDVHPIGWNIANGGSDNRAELLNPQETIERELREELIIADFDNYERYVFQGYPRKSLDHPAHAVARRLWARKFPRRDLDGLKTADVQIEWQPGPDVLHVQMGKDKPLKRQGFFLNINGEDFGIEFDRVAKMVLPGSVILFDGELEAGKLVNSPVGLFKVERLNSLLNREASLRTRSRSSSRRGSIKPCYKPDFFFFDAKRYPDGSDIDLVLENEFLEHVRGFRSVEEIKEFKLHIEAGKQYGLCPVTERIIRRYLEAARLQH